MKTYSLKDVRLHVRERPVVPVDPEPLGKGFRSSLDVFRAFLNLNDSDQEQFLTLHLDNKNRVIAFTTVTVGTISESLAHPREVYRAAIVNGATGIILVHNHPSGDPTPSADDRAITDRLVEVGKVVGIKVLDHVIVGTEGRYYSFADQNVL